MADKSLSIRFVGDSGDGIQLVGQQFTINLSKAGIYTCTHPDFPAEIRAPAGTLEGVSGFQVAFSDKPVETAGDSIDVLVAFNPAALKTATDTLKSSSLVIINQDNFEAKDYKKARLQENLLDEVRTSVGQIIEAPITSLTLEALNESELSHSEKKKAKNFFVLGIVCWLFDLKLKPIEKFLQQKFKHKQDILTANQKAVTTGYNYALTLELSRSDYYVKKSKPTANTRQINGVEAVGLACAAMTVKTGVELLVSGYPITPASNILHEMAKLKEFGITLFQAEDEIAAICASLGASFAGKLALTCTSGPGLDLKAEGLSLAVMTELPLVVIDVMRAGPSTGLPTKTEQSDLNMALYGRHGESPLPVLAAKSPSDCFDTLLEAFQVAIKAMTPVIMLMDAQLANGQHPWTIPNPNELPIEEIKFNQQIKPYQRDKELSRPWITPGTKDLMHRIGGLEKHGDEGKVSYDPLNHQHMVTTRQEKINRLAKTFTLPEIEGEDSALTLVISWGSTYGAVKSAVKQCCEEGIAVAMLHLRHLNPLPSALGSCLAKYKQILVCELNQGQLLTQIRAEYLIDAKGINQCSGQAFSVTALTQAIIDEVNHEYL
jgi:2-oxoglutarate ferredoxin oxidoreductase subunit alpha